MSQWLYLKWMTHLLSCVTVVLCLWIQKCIGLYAMVPCCNQWQYCRHYLLSNMCYLPTSRSLCNAHHNSSLLGTVCIEFAQFCATYVQATARVETRHNSSIMLNCHINLILHISVRNETIDFQILNEFAVVMALRDQHISL